MKTRNKLLIGIVTAVAITGGLAACGHHHTAEERANYAVERISNKLDLDTNQVANLEQLKNSLMASRQRVIDEQGRIDDALEQLLANSTLDQQQVLTMIRQRTEAINREAPTIVAAAATFFDNLTPEQQAELRDKIREHKAHNSWYH